MKRVINLLTALVFFSLIIFVSCKGDDGGDEPTLTPQQEQAAKLEGEWSVASAELGDQPHPDFTDLVVTFTVNEAGTGGNIAVTGVPEGGEVVWAASEWSFNGESTTEITRGDLPTLTNVVVSETALSVEMDNTPSARVAGFEGAWTFTFEKAAE